MIEITRSDGLVTSDEAAALCGVSRAAVQSWVRQKRLPVVARDGWRLLFSLVDVARIDHQRGPHAYRDPERPSWGPGLDSAMVLAMVRAAAESAVQEPLRKPVVYYLRFADRIKIGTTTNLRRRLDSVPHDRLLATEPGGADVERKRHQEFAQFRISGEWFKPGEPLMAHIASIK